KLIINPQALSIGGSPVHEWLTEHRLVRFPPEIRVLDATWIRAGVETICAFPLNPASKVVVDASAPEEMSQLRGHGVAALFLAVDFAKAPAGDTGEHIGMVRRHCIAKERVLIIMRDDAAGHANGQQRSLRDRVSQLLDRKSTR